MEVFSYRSNFQCLYSKDKRMSGIRFSMDVKAIDPFQHKRFKYFTLEDNNCLGKNYKITNEVV